MGELLNAGISCDDIAIGAWVIRESVDIALLCCVVLISRSLRLICVKSSMLFCLIVLTDDNVNTQTIDFAKLSLNVFCIAVFVVRFYHRSS